MANKRNERVAAVVVVVLMAGAVAAADWGGLENRGAPVAYLSQLSVAWFSPTRAVMVGVRDDGGVMRLGASLLSGGTWTAVNGSVDAGTASSPRMPQVVADGAGHAVVLHGGFSVATQRLYARWFDGAEFSEIAGGTPADPEAGGNVCGFAGTFVTSTKLLVAFTKHNGVRMALLVRSWNGGGWQDENGGEPLDDPGGIGSDSPVVAPDGRGGALVAFVQYGNAGARLVAMRLDGTGWHAVNGGAALDRPDLGGVSSPEVAALADGRWLVVWVQEDADGMSQRLYGSVWTGSAWERVNGGEPLDTYPKGVRHAAIAADGAGGWIVTYSTEDVVDGEDAPTVRAVRVTGLAGAPMNGGDMLEAAGALAIPSLAVGTTGAGALLVMEEESGGVARVYARAILAPVAATAAAGTPLQATDGLQVTHNLFWPARGEQARIVCSTSTTQRVRVTVYSLAGVSVRVVADGSTAGRMEYGWDGRDDSGQGVSAGVYLLVAEAGTSRNTRKIVVVR